MMTWKQASILILNGRQLSIVGQKVMVVLFFLERLGFNDLVTTHPYIAKEWYSVRNEKFKPTKITSGSKKEVWWINGRGKVWKARIYDRTKNVVNN